MIIWGISDTHFCHTNIIEYCSRPFSSMEEMNEKLIANWNSVVGPDDWVIHGGDFAYGRKAALFRLITIRKKLKGKIALIWASHDRIHSLRKWREAVGIDVILKTHLSTLEIGDLTIVRLLDEAARVEGNVMYFSHRPIRSQRALPYYYGHIHNHLSQFPSNGTNLCIELNNYTPVKLAETTSER